jgi:hypothetical protein
MQWLRQQNELDYHLGNIGFAEKQRKWQKEDKILAQQGLENSYDKFCGRVRPFMHSHSKLTESDDVIFYSQSTSEVAQRFLRESSERLMVRGKMTPSPRPCKPRSNEVVFVVFPVSSPRRRIFWNTNLCIGSGK